MYGCDVSSTAKHELCWIPENVSKVMARNGIPDRAALAKRVGLGRTTVYSAFRADWSGVATHTVLAHIAGEFGVSITRLVTDPGKRRVGAQGIEVLA
ncbi:Cro protein [Mycobacterium Phage Nergal]|nr:Cro protein [Mycobacterium Phage Nergal]